MTARTARHIPTRAEALDRYRVYESVRRRLAAIERSGRPVDDGVLAAVRHTAAETGRALGLTPEEMALRDRWVLDIAWCFMDC